jgi:hypothetical protein
LAGAAATLAFFVVFRVRIKLFFCIAGSSSFEIWPGVYCHPVQQACQTPRSLKLVLALQMKIGLARTETSIVQERR